MHAASNIVGGMRHFDRLAITCVFGNARNPRWWSGALANLACALDKLGVMVEGFRPQMSHLGKLAVAAFDFIVGRGRPLSAERILHGMRSRDKLGAQVTEAAERLAAQHVLHTGTSDLPAPHQSSVKHYLYCDHSWALARTHDMHATRLNKRAMAAFESAEREALSGLAHVFTFGACVRGNLQRHVLEHYSWRRVAKRIAFP